MGRIWRSRAMGYAVSAAPVPKPARFLVVCQPRSGSELLVELLNSVPGVECVSEPLRKPAYAMPRLLEGWAKQGRLQGAKAWGAKLLLQDLMWNEPRYGDGPDVFRGFVERGWTLVHLERRAPLSSALSALRAEMTQKWHDREEHRGEFVPLDVDVAMVISWLHAMDGQDKWAQAALASVPHEQIDYHRDLLTQEARQAAVDRLCARLGVPSGPVSTTLVPTAPSDPWTRITNPEDLRAALRYTRFAALADEAARPADGPS